MRRVCVYCGSNPGARTVYVEAARELGQELADRGLGLVYGGACIGTMGVIADAVLEAGGEKAIGVIPHHLANKEIAHGDLTELHAVDSMHERKALMEQLSDGFVTLPGGYGTHDELFEILAWLQLGIHAKPVGILNVGGYYDALIAYLDHTVCEGFILPKNRELLLVDETSHGLLERMFEWMKARETAPA